MFDLIQQNMGNGMSLMFMGQAILLILVIFGLNEAIRRNERRRSENKVSWFFEQRLKWISSKLNRQRIARRRAFAKNWKKFQSSDVSPSGHRGWQFGWNKDYDLLARIKTVSGEMTMIITHIDTVIMGNVFHGQDELANSIVKDFVKDDKMLAAHLATAQLIKSANEFISRLEKPQPITRWLDPKTPDGFDATLTERDPLKETAPARFMGARDSFYIDDGKEAKEYLATHQTDIMKSGYKIKDGAVFCPHHQNTAEASKFCTIAASKLTKAGIAAGYIKFSFPDREAVAKPLTNPRNAMLAAIQTQLAQNDLKTLKNVTDDNCADCPYEEGSGAAKQFVGIVNGRALHWGVNFTFNYPSSVIPFSGKKEIPQPSADDRQHMIDTVNSHLIDMAPMTGITDDNCVGCPYQEGSPVARAFEGVVRGQMRSYNIEPTFTYGDLDGFFGRKTPAILDRGEEILTRDATPPLDTSKLVPLPTPVEPEPPAPILRVFNAGVKNAWDWQQIPNKVAGRIIFLKEVQGHHYIIVLDSVVCHESDADEDGNLLLVMATLLIANEKWEDFTELRRLWRVEELIGKDDDIDACHNNLCYALENIARQINGALDDNLTEFCASLTCPFEDATDEQKSIQNKITMQVISNGDFTPPTADGTDGGTE